MNLEHVDVTGATLQPAGVPLRAAVLSVGSELLLGDLTDTNATWISQRCRELGIEVRHHLAVRDDLDEFVDALSFLADRVHVVLIGGGLGPTSDDLTREAVAAAAGVELERHDDLEEALIQRFAEMGARMPAQNLRQARIPRGATVFEPVGTAPGFGLTILGGTRVYAAPGVPWELHSMWDRDIAPELLALAGAGATLTRIVHVVGRGESSIAEIVEPLVADRPGVTLSFLAKSEEVQVRLTVTADDAVAAREASQPLVEEVVGELGSSVAGIDEETLEDVLVRLLGATGTTVATAESATAGGISARLARVPGASHGLLGGVAVYATDAKHRLLDVDEGLLDEHGPVSGPVTDALARAARDRFGADWGIAVTGVAGPTEQNGLPIGTCFWALAHPDGRTEVHGRRIPGDRGQIQARLGTAALDLLRRRLLEHT
ncbi:CinA family nicotinamide mononucleotide deamidase-related protein [Nitriliruptor alkaliphilus]|uniref:CinA family nicotinamide mononucleotide deamidase-related protein n=1 Tax=Nitriliruptor alkaliphilus TaxID=427918 RepID=UPI000697A510|nr:CinA family nicotinamide mononucleotide deamidase-related protein [Nitriliruptor alkaliphilus]